MSTNPHSARRFPHAGHTARTLVLRLFALTLGAASMLALAAVASAQTLPAASASGDRVERAASAGESKPAQPWVFGSFYRGFGVTNGRLSGRLGSQLGVTVGKRSVELMLGGLPDNQLLSFGLLVPRFAGSVLSGRSGKLSILWPSGEAHVITDASQNLYFNLGLAPCGLSFEQAFGDGHALFLQFRTPLLALWLPAKVNGAWISGHRVDGNRPVQQAKPFLSLGVGLEAGIVL